MLPGTVGAVLPVDEFPPAELFTLADGPSGDIVFTVRRDWGMLAAVGRIQSTTPPGREMMNHSGSLLAKVLDYRVVEERLRSAALHDHLTGLPNRLLGHQAGDQLLIQVARRLTGLLRSTDTVVRLGGDSAARAGIEAAVTDPYSIDGHIVEVGLSIGPAISGDGSSGPGLMLRAADAARYRAKSASRRR